MSVPIQESEPPWICVLVVSNFPLSTILFYQILELFRQCDIFVFSFQYFALWQKMPKYQHVYQEWYVHNLFLLINKSRIKCIFTVYFFFINQLKILRKLKSTQKSEFISSKTKYKFICLNHDDLKCMIILKIPL